MTLRYLLDTSIVSSPISKNPDPGIVRRIEEHGSACAIAAPVWHGNERAGLEALGRPRLFVDGQIAAIAHANDLILVSVNDKDFKGFKGITVENWAARRSSKTSS